jgi:hypothetical protein
MKLIIIIITFFISLPLFAQGDTILTFNKLEKELTNYLIETGEVYEPDVKYYISGERSIRISGFHNNLSKGSVKNGVYSFFLKRTMARGYFFIVDNNQYKILNITTREGLDESIKEVLDFCDKYKYCVEISKEYVMRLVEVYYNFNKWPNQRRDLNCEEGRGVTDTKDLP